MDSGKVPSARLFTSREIPLLAVLSNCCFFALIRSSLGFLPRTAKLDKTLRVRRDARGEAFESTKGRVLPLKPIIFAVRKTLRTAAHDHRVSRNCRFKRDV